MDLKLDDSLKSLIDLGKRSGFLTWDQVNAQIPPDTVEPERLDAILEMLEQHGISIIEEDQADDGGRPGRARGRELPGRPGAAVRRRRRRQAHRRPGPHVPHPDGRDPPAGPRQGNLPRQEDRGHPPVVPPQGPRVRLRPPGRSSTSCKQVHSEELPFDRTIKISQTEKLEKDQILKRMPHNLRTVEPLMDANTADFEQLIDRTAPDDGPGRGSAGGSSCAASKAVTLVEELSDPDAEDPAADEEDGADLRPDDASSKSRSRPSAPAGRRRTRRTGRTSRSRTRRPDAADPRRPGEPAASGSRS